MTSSTSASRGRYVPPHLRKRPAYETQASSAASTSTNSFRNPSPTRHNNNANPQCTYSNKSASRTPWAIVPVPTTSASSSSSRNTSAERSGRDQPITARGGAGFGIGTSAPSSSLHVFGDSFVGPLKLLEEDCVRVTTFKGASAKVSHLNTRHIQTDNGALFRA
jgi:hypothetical protein